jgi:hypothetical protein
VFFIAYKFVDIVHDSKLFGKFQGAFILFPNFMISVHLGSVILMSENGTHEMMHGLVCAVY